MSQSERETDTATEAEKGKERKCERKLHIHDIFKTRKRVARERTPV